MDATVFRYITDALTPEEALAMLKAREDGKKEREAIVRKDGYVQRVQSSSFGPDYS